MTLAYFAILFRAFGVIALEYFKIIWLSNLSVLSVPTCSEGYSRSALNYIYVFIRTRVNYIFIIVQYLLDDRTQDEVGRQI